MVSLTGAFRATLYFNNNTTAVDTNVDMRRPSDAFLRGDDGGGAMQKVRVTVTSSTQVALSWSRLCSSVALDAGTELFYELHHRTIARCL